MKTLKDLKKEYQTLEEITNFEDLKDLASNFIRMVTWKKEKDLEYIKNTYVHIIPKLILDIKKVGYNEHLKVVKNNDLHKAFNIKYLYAYYDLDYQTLKNELKTQKLEIL